MTLTYDVECQFIVSPAECSRHTETLPSTFEQQRKRLLSTKVSFEEVQMQLHKKRGVQSVVQSVVQTVCMLIEGKQRNVLEQKAEKENKL